VRKAVEIRGWFNKSELLNSDVQVHQKMSGSRLRIEIVMLPPSQIISRFELRYAHRHNIYLDA
jgi:hypothetical protein